ncbi:hypothetical protein AMELA_G00141310, partial [Ameiurus melas]
REPTRQHEHGLQCLQVTLTCCWTSNPTTDDGAAGDGGRGGAVEMEVEVVLLEMEVLLLKMEVVLLGMEVLLWRW